MEQEKPLPKSTKNVLKLFLEIFDLSAIPPKRQLFFKNVILYYTGSNLLTLKVAIYLKRKLHFFSVTFFTDISEMHSESSRTSKAEIWENI